MKFLSSITLKQLGALIAILMYFSPAAVLADEELISKISVEGNRRIPYSTVMLQVSSQPGAPLDDSAVQNDVKEIYKTGFFEQVTAKVRQRGNSSELVFDVVEKPALRGVLLQGNDEVGDDTIKEKLNVSARRFLDKQKILAGIAELKKHYQTLGYYDTEIDYTVTPVLDNQVDVTFKIKEGEKVRLRKVAFEGNRKIDTSDLESIVKTSSYSWWSSWITGTGVVKEEQLEADTREITRYYLNNGYADVRISEPEVERDEKGLKVTFKITEGEQYTFDEITVSGDLIGESVQTTLDGIKAEPGKTFNVDDLRQDSFLITDKFTDLGYAFANVEPLTEIDRDAHTVSIKFNVNKGERITVNRINIRGNTKTLDNVVRRTLKINERDQFSSSSIRRSQELLSRLGYFDEVTITPESTEKKDEVDLNVSVREGSTGTFSAGAGVSSGEGFIVNTRVSENNLFGYGYSLALNVDVGSRNDNVVVSFDNPRVNDSWWSAGFDILSVEREFDDYDRRQQGGSITFGYPLVFLGAELLDDFRFTIKYEYLNIKINNVDEDAPVLIQDQEGTSTSSGITPRLVRNTIDNPLNPSRGSRQLISLEMAGLGGSEEFWLFRFTNTWYYPLVDTDVGPIVFSNRIRFGYGDTWDGDDFPLFRRFFPGGINSVRGFESGELGPKDENGNEYGGSKELDGNFEIIFPMFAELGLKGVVFYDVGNAFDDDENIDLAELRHAFGWGFRWNSPLGPIRVEVGYPIDREEGEKGVVTHFSFGAPL
ncbi:MAG: outer membrane protein assembly factor BamA [Bdellovibrionales bacterium]|nr:outer membrane protein assembly factor BamA [Bdellovibrionales bacterium]